MAAAVPLAVQLAPAAASVVGSIINWLSGKSQANAQKEYNNMVARLHNEWLTTRKKEVKDILDLLQSQGQNLFGPQVTTGSQTGTQSFSETETPEILPQYQPLDELQTKLLERRLTSPTGLPAGYTETGIQAINESAAPGLQDIENLARKRGLSADVLKIGSPVERDRLGRIAEFRAQTPLTARELQTEDIGLAEKLLQARMARKRKGYSTSASQSTMTAPPAYSSIFDLLLTPGPKAATM